MDTPQLSCTRHYSQRPKSHFSADARELLFEFNSTTSTGTRCYGAKANNDFSHASSVEGGSRGSPSLCDNRRMAATLAEGTAPKLSF